MSITADQAKKILVGNYTFSQLGFSMFVTRLKGVYAKDSSQEVLLRCTAEINTFLGKYKIIMGADFAVISQL